MRASTSTYLRFTRCFCPRMNACRCPPLMTYGTGSSVGVVESWTTIVTSSSMNFRSSSLLAFTGRSMTSMSDCSMRAFPVDGISRTPGCPIFLLVVSKSPRVLRKGLLRASLAALKRAAPASRAASCAALGFLCNLGISFSFVCPGRMVRGKTLWLLEERLQQRDRVFRQGVAFFCVQPVDQFIHRDADQFKIGVGLK